MNKQVDEAKEIIKKLIKTNDELRTKLKQYETEDEELTSLISEAKKLVDE